jgi:hypothetical protein
MNLPSHNHRFGRQRGLVATTVVLVLIGLIAALLAASIETVNHTRRELRAIEEKQLERPENNATTRRPGGP